MNQYNSVITFFNGVSRFIWACRSYVCCVLACVVHSLVHIFPVMLQFHLNSNWLVRVLAIMIASGSTVIVAEDRIVEVKQSEAITSSAGQSENNPGVYFFWKNGLFAESSDKAYRFHFGGEMDFDNGWYQVPANIQDSLNTPLLEGTAIRRLRVGFDSYLQKKLEFKLEADFTRASEYKQSNTEPQSSVFITDAWLAMHDVPLFDVVKLGHQKQLLSFNNATSSRFYPFMEKPYVFDGYESDYGYGSGISFNRTYFDELFTSWFGLFWNGTRSQSFNVGNGYSASGRLTWMPLHDEQANRWLVFGIAGSVNSIQSSGAQVTVRPLVRTGQSSQIPNLIDTGEYNGYDGQKLGTLSANSAWGPVTLGGEYQFRYIQNAYIVVTDPNNPDQNINQSVGNLFFPGFFVEALCFLTPGDRRTVDRRNPGYDRITPVHSFLGEAGDGLSCEHGYGAWEVGVRFDHIDVNSAGIQAGSLNSVTLGLNWYLNSNTSFVLNYVHTYRDTNDPATSGVFHSVGIRFHVDF